MNLTAMLIGYVVMTMAGLGVVMIGGCLLIEWIANRSVRAIGCWRVAEWYRKAHPEEFRKTMRGTKK